MLAGPTLQNLAWLGQLLASFISGTYLTRKYLPRRAVGKLASVLAEPMREA